MKGKLGNEQMKPLSFIAAAAVTLFPRLMHLLLMQLK